LVIGRREREGKKEEKSGAKRRGRRKKRFFKELEVISGKLASAVFESFCSIARAARPAAFMIRRYS